MPYTEKQRRAAFAELGRRKEGGKARNFRGMNAADLRTYAHAPKEKAMAKGKGKGKGGFPDFFKKGKAKKRGGGPTASDQADALRSDEAAEGEGHGPGKGFVPFKKKGKGY